MKKIISVLLIVSMLAVMLCSCGNSSENNNTVTTQGQDASQTTQKVLENPTNAQTQKKHRKTRAFTNFVS